MDMSMDLVGISIRIRPLRYKIARPPAGGAVRGKIAR